MGLVILMTPNQTSIIAAADAARSQSAHPEFVTLPAIGGDPVTGLSRSFWYKAESDGLIQLTRVRLPGRLRGRTLLPIPQAIALLKRLGEDTKASDSKSKQVA